MSLVIAIITGVLAFVGSIVGHFMAFDLNAAAKRRDVRRAQIERFAGLLGDDQTWMDDYQRAATFGVIPDPIPPAPYNRAFSVYRLYFQDELREAMLALERARHEYRRAGTEVFMARLNRARERSQLANTLASQEEREPLRRLYRPYLQAIYECLDVAARIVAETLPKESWWQRLAARFLPRR